MTDSCEIDVEVGGNVGISVAEERVIVLRRASNAKEESTHEKLSRRRAVELTVVWRIFKSIVFFICLTFLIVQSVDFLGSYYKYPTTIVTEITMATEFKLPAITFCFRSTISFNKFCLHEPDRCESPSNMEDFCTKHPIHCEEDNSTLKIPMQDYETREIMQHYLFNDSYNDDERLFKIYKYAYKTRTFIYEIDDFYMLFLKCYSENLHLYRSGSEPKTEKLEISSITGHRLKWYSLDMRNIELFYMLDHPLVFVGIHSPFVPLDPDLDLYPIRRGAKTKVYVQLEKEEHLLPPPYQTNCRDNGPSEDPKESSNPNSFQVCVELCRSEYAKAVRDCGYGMTMISSPSVLLCDLNVKEPDLSEEQRRELEKQKLICMQNCKQGCLKLQYKYKIKEIKRFWGIKSTRSTILIYVKNPEVTVLRHIPLYGSGDIFSHIGGLLGCWLGISVFTFTDILEKLFRKVVRWKRRFRKEEQQRPPTCEIHQD